MAKHIDFIKNKTFVGLFTLFSKEYSGRLIYESNGEFTLTLYDAPAIFLNIHIESVGQKKEDGAGDDAEYETVKTIQGIVYDEDNVGYYVTLAKCMCKKSPLFGTGCLQFYFRYAIFSEKRYFNLINDKSFTVNLYFNTWSEFCFPQGFKSLVTMSNKPNIEIVLKNKLKVIFSENISAEFINTEDLFSNLFVSCGNNCLTEDEIAKLNKQMKDVVEPYKGRLYRKRDETHKWFIAIENVPDIESVNSIIWKFCALIKILTYDFATDIDMAKIRVKGNDNGPLNEAEFYYLCDKTSCGVKNKYNSQHAAFRMGIFSKDEWKPILNSILTRKDDNWLLGFFQVLIENNSGKPISIFHMARYIDYIGAIGSSRYYSRKLKYEQVLLDFIEDLDVDMKRKLLSAFRHNLSKVKIADNKQGKLRNWSLIGKKLSEFRAYVAHAGEKKQMPSMHNAIHAYKIIELVIIDYIFEILGVQKSKRLKYKKRYLRDYIAMFF